jgi:hypothetical protein
VRSPLFAPTLLLLVMFCGCGETVSGIPFQRGRAKPPLTAIDKEAAREAIDRWKLTRGSDGECYYACQVFAPPTDFLGLPSNTPNLKLLAEMRHVSVDVEPWDVSEASKLNGVEWEGTVSLQFEAIRLHPQVMFSSSDKTFHPNNETWSQWETNPSFVRFGTGCFSYTFSTFTKLKRVNGCWQVVAGSFEKVQPSDLPK